MSKGLSRFAVLVAGVALSPIALAAAPSNDDFANATLIDSIPYFDAEDTTGATAEWGEPDFWGWGPGASVWYEWTADTDGWLAADTTGSTPTEGCFGDPADGCYDTTLTIWHDDGTGFLVPVAHNDDTGFGVRTSYAPWAALAGETYWIQVGNYNGGGGGDLELTVDTYVPPDPYVMTATLTDVQSTLKTGEVKLSGTIACSEPGWFSLSIRLEQTSGRFKPMTFGFASGVCDATTATWTGTGFSSGGIVVGRASYEVAGFGAADATGQPGTTLITGSITASGRGR